jgi:putative SbcD/Mre11-related phosphoesterase
MEILKGIEIIDLALYIKKQNILILSDIHIGYEESLNKQGILVPRFQFKDQIIRIGKILDSVKIKTIIINGDLKHEFGKISEQEWRETLKFLDLLSKKSENVILLKGNHDKILTPIAGKRNLKIEDYFMIDDIYFCHGDKIPKDADFKKAKTVIIGHEHPAISFKERPTDKFKCFLKGKYKTKKLIVQPSFNLVTEGTDITKDSLLSPFLKQDLKKFEVWIVGDKVRFFGKIKEFLA